MDKSDEYILGDKANIAVIGGGPTGSFFSIFALKMAKMVGKELNITIFEPKDFTKDGPGGCNKCGGIISELLVQTLAVEGINLPDAVVRRGINSYKLHTNQGDTSIATPYFEKTIATVYRGGGPKGMIEQGKESFDKFLLGQAVKEGAVHKPLRIDKIEYKNKKPVLFSQKHEVMEADLVVGAFGVKGGTAKIFEGLGFGYKEPRTVTAAIAEINMGDDIVGRYFGNSIHLFFIPDKNVKFAAMIPKGSYVTLCILGKDINPGTVNDFLGVSAVKRVVPDVELDMIECRCLPKMNIGASVKPFTDRIVMCGDAGSTRLFKDGLSAAYLTGKTAAKTAVFQGVSEQHFRKDYYPVYKRIVIDNAYGKCLYSIIDISKKSNIFTKGMLEVIRKEQQDSHSRKVLSLILWDMFTGNERYKNIFPKIFDVRMNCNLWKEVAKTLVY